MQNLKSLQSLVLDESNIEEYLEIFTSTADDYDRIFRNVLLQKFKKYYKQDLLLWRAIAPYWIQTVNKKRNAAFYKQFNVLLLIFLDSNFGMEIIKDTIEAVLVIINDEIELLDELEFGLFLFLKPLVALMTKLSIQIDLQKYLEFGIAALDSSLESRLLASVLIGTLLSKYSEMPISKTIKVLSNCTDEDLDGELKLISKVTRNPEKQILVIGGILQCNPHSLLALPLESFISLYNTLHALIITHSESKVQTFGFQALSRWFQVALLKKMDAPKDIITQSLILVLDKWDDSAVSQQKLREIFGGMVELVLSDNEILPFIITKLSQIYGRKVKYDLFTILATKVPSNILFQLNPNVLKDTIKYLDRPSLNQSAAAFIIHLLKKLAQDKQDIKRFYLDIAEALVSPSEIIRKNTAERILPVFAKLDFEGLNLITGAIEQGDEVCLEALVSCMKVAKGFGRPIKIESEYEIIQKSITSVVSRLRYQAFCYVTESSKANQDVTVQEIDFVKQYWILDGCGETVDYRQQISATYSRYFGRLKRSIYKNQRDIFSLEKKLSNRQELINEIQPEILQITNQMNMKKEFFNWIFNEALGSLYPGSSFSRTIGAIIILDLLNQTEKLVVDISATISLQLLEFSSSKIYQIIFSRIVFDSFGDSRRDLLMYLKKNDLPKLEYGNQSFCQYLITKVEKLFVSKRAADSDSAAYICRIIYVEYIRKHCFPLDQVIASPEVDFLNLLIGKLQSHYDFAVDNLVDASISHPLYSILNAIHNILQEIQFEDYATWESSIDGLTRLCISVCKLCQKVCSDPSPEGNLPVQVEAGTESQTAQILLRHCFRSIKQAASCISLISEILLGGKHQSAYEYVKVAGELFSDLLTTVRHRGAFNSVQENLSIVCKLVSSNQKYHHLLQDWLDNFIGQISSLEVSVTRRSAGLPAAILAIVSAPNNERKAALLHYTIEKVIFIAKTEVDSKNIQIDLPQVHAMNVLRILVLDSELTTITRDYLGACFEICIMQFKSDYFPIRNCAAMLFSSLVNKSFGTKKTKSEGDLVNLVFAREFFSKYPSLYKVILDELQNAVKLLKQNQVCPLLYPLLGILSRTKPVPLESEDALYSSKVFEVLVKECAHAVQWKVREISSRTLAALVDSARCYEVACALLSQLKPVSTANFAHGVSLQVSEILEAHWHEYASSHPDANTNLAKAFISIGWIFSNDKFAVARGVFLGVLHKQFFELEKNTEIDQVRQIALETSKKMLDGTASLMYCPQYHIQTACSTVCHPLNYEQNIEFIVSVLEKEDSNRIWMLFDLIPSRTSHPSVRNLAVKYFMDNSKIDAVVTACAKVISNYENKVEVIDAIIYWLDKQTTFDLIKSLLSLLSLVVIETKQYAQLLISKCKRYLQDDQPVDLRLAAAQSLNGIRFVKLEQLELDYCVLLLSILEDDDEEVRGAASAAVSHLSSVELGVCDTLARSLILKYIEKFDPIGFHVSVLCTDDYKRLYSMNSGLFDQEEMNSYKQPFKNIINSLKSMEKPLAAKYLDHLTAHIQTVWTELSKLSDIEWSSNYELVFNIFAQIISISRILKFNGNASWYNSFRNLKLHQLLLPLFEQ
ncbi:hypothetical protein HDV01_001226 [Terramyces sp. JEL0728]|nr:hypothetical protein HDV01_001226 [Terramyces sp. JEL0728]